MGTEYPNSPAIPLRPASPFSVPLSSTPFKSSGPVVGPEASAFRHAPPSSSQITALSSSSGSMVGTEASAFRTITSGMPNGAARPPPTSGFPNMPPAAGPAPQFSSIAQVPPPRTLLAGQPVLWPPVRPLSGSFSTSPVCLNPTQPPPVQMGSPPQSGSMVQPDPVAPRSPIDSQFSAARATMQQSSPTTGSVYPAARPSFQSSFPGYISQQTTAGAQAQPRQSLAFPPQPGGCVPPMPATSSPYLAQQGGYAAPPSVASQLGHPREQIRHPGSTHPMAVMQGLVEDFSSFSIGSVPGSFDSGLDSKVLPRPLEGDLERNTLSEMFPLNCSSRYLRLTTSGIPNSQSLASRWHLPLGAVVCPLAEAPNGEEVPVVNFAQTGIIWCKRCRTYVNPYVTFTDSGRKWRCN